MTLVKPKGIIYLYTDESTGEQHSLTLRENYVKAIHEYLLVGKEYAIPVKFILQKLGDKDTDTNRRHFRAAAQFWVDKGLAVCSTTSGYYIAETRQEILDCIRNKEKQIKANQLKVEKLWGLDVEFSSKLFNNLLRLNNETSRT